MRDLVVGDWVLVDNTGTYERIYDFGHWNVDVENVEYLQISLDSGQSLELSADHMVYVNQQQNFVPASMVTVGDVLSSPVEGSNKVRLIRSVIRHGAIAPFTSSGTIVVDGILASCYVAFQPSSYLVVGGTTRDRLPNKNNSMTPPPLLLPRTTMMTTYITHQWLAHTFEFPHRFYCSHIMQCRLDEDHVRACEPWPLWMDSPCTTICPMAVSTKQQQQLYHFIVSALHDTTTDRTHVVGMSGGLCQNPCRDILYHLYLSDRIGPRSYGVFRDLLVRWTRSTFPNDEHTNLSSRVPFPKIKSMTLILPHISHMGGFSRWMSKSI
jgi:hypothetical protein